MLAPNHNHGGPSTIAYDDDANNDLVDYNRELRDKLVTITQEAVNNMQPALIGSGKGICKMSMNRRALNANGGIRIGKNPYGHIDQEVGVIRIDDSRRMPFSIIVNWPTHPAVMGGENLMITGDWPGATRRYIEREYTFPVSSIITSGASGDIDPIYHHKPNFRQGETEEIGIILGKEVIRVANEISTLPATSISALQRVITLPGKIPGGSYLPGDHYSPGPDVDVRLTLLRVGNILFAGISGEVFSEIGVQIKKLSPFKYTYVLGHCNGASGYLITDVAYQEGGFELSATRVMSGAELGIISNFIEMINEIE